MSVEVFKALAAALPKLSAGDATFAKSLCVGFQTHGAFTPKQMYWAEKLVARASAPAVVQTAAAVVDVSGIVRLFTEAAPKLKYPKVRLVTASGEKLVLSRAGGRSRYVGDVMLTDGGGFDAGKYFGRIAASTGEVFNGRDMTPEVLALLVQFSSDPAGIGSVIGKRTGNCCFCARGLETKESLAVGYGPVCATNYSLPWG